MIYLLRRHDIISVPSYAAVIYHRTKVRYHIGDISPVPTGTDIIEKPLFCQIDKRVVFVAEKKGFEPLIPLWGIHDFQSCALDQATRLLHALFGLLSFQIVSLHIIIKIYHKVKSHFERNAFFERICFSPADRQADFARFGRGSGPAAPWRPAFGAAGTARCSPPRRAAPPA